jgi:small subunit ribosomal protein S20
MPTCAWARLGKNRNHPFGDGLSGLSCERNKDPKEDRQMANTEQSKKRARQSIARNAVNKARRSRIRTFVRKVEEAIATGDASVAADALKNAQPELARGVTKGVLHKNTVSRKISRLAARVKALSAPKA